MILDNKWGVCYDLAVERTIINPTGGVDDDTEVYLKTGGFP
jgi:hypothetical protein